MIRISLSPSNKKNCILVSKKRGHFWKSCFKMSCIPKHVTILTFNNWSNAKHAIGSFINYAQKLPHFKHVKKKR